MWMMEWTDTGFPLDGGRCRRGDEERKRSRSESNRFLNID